MKVEWLVCSSLGADTLEPLASGIPLSPECMEILQPQAWEREKQRLIPGVKVGAWQREFPGARLQEAGVRKE